MTAGAVDVALDAPPSALFPARLALPEDRWFDRNWIRIGPRKLAESLVGFANADGETSASGLFGGTVEGVDADPRRVNALMQSAVGLTEPTVLTSTRLYACTRADGSPDHVMIIEFRPGRLTFMQRRELFYDKSQSSYETEPTAAPLSDVDDELVETYANALRVADPERMLTARGFAAGGRLTVAGLLLFGRHPERQLPSAQVRVCRFTGTRLRDTDWVEWTGNSAKDPRASWRRRR